LTWPWPSNPSVWPPGGPPAGPPITPTIGWYDASNAGSITGNPVTSLADLSGQGHTLPAVGVSKFGTGNNFINGRNTLNWTGGNTGTLQTGAFTVINQPYTVFVVAQILGAGATQVQFTANIVAGCPALGVFDAGSHWDYYAGSVVTSATVHDTAPHILTGIFQGASSSLFLDNTLIANGNPGATTLSNLGINWGGAAASTSWLFAEALFYSSAFNASDRTNAYNYLKNKWGTP
jgi:hypothetical protein